MTENKLSKYFNQNIMVENRKGYIVGFDDTRFQVLFEDSLPDEPEWVPAHKVKFILNSA